METKQAPTSCCSAGKSTAEDNNQHGYYDDLDFAAEHVRSKSGYSEVTLLAKDIHCAACVGLIESLPKRLSGVLSARVNFAHSTVNVHYDERQVKLSEIAEKLKELGFPSTPFKPRTEREGQQQTSRSLLVKIGIAAVAAGNTMMLAVSLYQGEATGIEASHRSFLQWVSAIVSLPAVAYSALPFYRAAILGLRVKTLHIDLPISIGILGGYTASLYSTIFGLEHTYFESISSLIFLLLLGRWIQRLGVAHAIDKQDILHSLVPLSARISREGKTEEIYSGSVTPGTQVIVKADEVIPVDGEVIEGSSHLNNAVLTGEAKPVAVSRGQSVIAGAKNYEGQLLIRATSSGRATRLGKLLAIVEQGAKEKPPLASTTDRLAGYFVFFVLVLTTLGGLAWWYYAGPIKAFEVSLALIIVLCPCALGMAAPLALSVAVFRASRVGLLVKQASVIERLAKISRVAFDKTGTLTSGSFEVTGAYQFNSGQFEKLQELSSDLASRVLSLEQQSEHPIARSLRQFCSEAVSGSYALEELDRHQEVSGKGVEAYDKDGEVWRLGKLDWVATDQAKALPALDDNQISSIVGLSKNKDLVAVFVLSDAPRAEARSTLDSLEAIGIESIIVSGDDSAVVSALAKELGLEADAAYGDASPEEKAKLLKLNPNTAFVGDGVNDGPALSAANVGLSVKGGTEMSLQAADVVLTRDSLTSVVDAIVGARRSLSLIRINLGLSLVYNIGGATLALAGFITPLVAAILMPLSSLTVAISSVSFPTFRQKQ